MREYTPHRWVVVKFTKPDGDTFHKVLAGWYGGYLDSASWQLNSGIRSVTVLDSGDYVFHGHSGSKYFCKPGCEGLTSLTASVLDSFEKEAEAAHVKLEIVNAAEYVEAFC